MSSSHPPNDLLSPSPRPSNALGRSSFSVDASGINLPKCGGAIRGTREKYSANPVTGTGSMTAPIATHLKRSGFGPQLSLSYDSGAGNGKFIFGWNLSLPTITRKTDKGLLPYCYENDPNISVFSGTEDLVPLLLKDQHGNWQKELLDPRVVDGRTYQINRYRPSIQGSFACINDKKLGVTDVAQ